jgi:acetate kinase
MTAHILTINAGSSSLKFALFDAEVLATVASGQIEGIGAVPKLSFRNGAGESILADALKDRRSIGNHAQAMDVVLSMLDEHIAGAQVAGIGHRVVHGGRDFDAPVVINERIIERLAGLIPLAALHQPHNLAGIAAAANVFPGVPQVACFDTAFHKTQDFINSAYALPRDLYEQGIRSYGFHGLSYEYVAERLREILPVHGRGRTVICHLGAGASLCATRNGRSVATTMGFSVLDGLPMATRPGQLDPGVLLHLMTDKGMDAKALSQLLYHECGLKGLSGLSGDMRVLQQSDDSRARQAIDYFTSRVRRAIASLAAVLEGLDAIVFSGGIGENAFAVREAVLTPMAWMGIVLDHDQNRCNGTVISSDNSAVKLLVIPTNEELMIARHTARELARGRAG